MSRRLLRLALSRPYRKNHRRQGFRYVDSPKVVLPTTDTRTFSRSPFNNTFYNFQLVSSQSSPRRRRQCLKVASADSARRHNFFKAKAKGSSTSRPKHLRKHKRSC